MGTVTDIDGNFSLKASVGDVLVFTFIGYEPIEYKLTAADTNLKVRFTDSSELLDEVVVVGYGVQKKSVLSSAVSRVTSEELDKGNPTNIQNALKVKFPVYRLSLIQVSPVRNQRFVFGVPVRSTTPIRFI